MKEQLKGRSFTEEEEFLSVFSELMNEIPLDMIMRVFADWDRGLRLWLLIEGEYVEQSFNMLWFLTGLDKHARRVRVSNAHPMRDPSRLLVNPRLDAAASSIECSGEVFD
jgi:hypothetical protein